MVAIVTAKLYKHRWGWDEVGGLINTFFHLVTIASQPPDLEIQREMGATIGKTSIDVL